MHEWPILIFTFLLTTAVGLAGISALYGFWLRNALNEPSLYRVFRLPLLTASVIAIVALAASFGHLGYPMNAPNAIRHIGSSWLSREIILTGGFIGAICLTTLLALKTGRFSAGLTALSFLIGVAAIVAMGEIYRNTSVVTWMHANTHVMFLSGMLVAGAVLGLFLITSRVDGLVSPTLARRMVFAALVCVAIGLLGQLLILPSYIQAINSNPINSVATFPLQPLELFQSHAGTRCLRWVLSIAGLFLLVYASGKSVFRNSLKSGLPLMAIAAIILLAGEFAGRYVFYSING